MGYFQSYLSTGKCMCSFSVFFLLYKNIDNQKLIQIKNKCNFHFIWFYKFKICSSVDNL